jgi:flavin reductase (DIM6/NTAB) family NADH-FMN oxidoreductase RutF
MEFVLKDIPVAERYKFLTAVVIPRPVALVTSRSEAGLHNAAPFSFFNLFSEEPAIVVLGFSARPDNSTKDTLRNIRKTEQFVVNMVDRRIIDAMHICSSDVPSDESEIDYAGVSLLPSRMVDVQRIAESPASLECRLFQLTNLTHRRTLVVGEVLCVHVLDEILDPATKRIIPEQYSPIARLYGNHYAWLGERYTKAIPSFDEVKADKQRRRPDGDR